MFFLRQSKKLIFPVMMILWVVASMSLAQPSTCPPIVEEALSTLDTICQQTGRNQACYGNINLQVQPSPDASALQFSQVGDIANISDIEALRLSPLDEVLGEWGVALMQLQADIPDALPGQNVTFLLFGDVEVVNVASPDESPMQAFFISTGIGQAPCAEAPQDGLLVQTPSGVERVSFNINGVDVQVGSTVFFQVAPNDEMRVTTIEGAAGFDIDDKFFPIIAGTQVRVPIDADLLPIGTPALPRAYDLTDVISLPVQLLERDIDITPALDKATLQTLRQLLSQQLPPCDADGLPDCDALSFDAIDFERLAQLDAWLIPISDEYFESLNDIRRRFDKFRNILPDGAFDERFEDFEDIEGSIDAINAFRINYRDRLRELADLRNTLRLELDDLDNSFRGDLGNAVDDVAGELDDVGNALDQLDGLLDDGRLPPPDGYLPDGTPCVLRPLPGDPPYPPNETRPYCPAPSAPAPDEDNNRDDNTNTNNDNRDDNNNTNNDNRDDNNNDNRDDDDDDRDDDD